MAENLKGLGIGTSDFKKLISDNSYFFDKTKFIEDIYTDHSEVRLFTRPRRFGKTLNMSMLKCFFDIREDNSALFKDLYIEKSAVFSKINTSPVIYISLKDLKAETWEETQKEIGKILSDLFIENAFVLDEINIFQKDNYIEICKGNFSDGVPKDAIKFLSACLHSYYGKRVILLMDEYDTPLVTAHQYGYYKEAVNFFTTLYSSALKDNEYLDFAVLTGIVRVANENIFSGLNNLSMFTILDEKYSDAFGLTEEDVKKALNYYQIEKDIDVVKDWYDGYKFGSHDIYNPWSITKYLDERKEQSYWIHTSGNYLIKNILEHADDETFENLEKLFAGKSIRRAINRYTAIDELVETENIWQILLFSGYLTVDEVLAEDEFMLKIPNREVKDFFKEEFLKIV